MKSQTCWMAVGLVVGCLSGFAGVKDVDTLIGTESRRADSANAAAMQPFVGVPFGMWQGVAMTQLSELGKVSYDEKCGRFLGFLATRQPAPWMGEYGQISVMPQIGAVNCDYQTRGVRFDKQKSVFTPYYCKLFLENGIVAELTGTSRMMMMRFGFPKGQRGKLVFDVSREFIARYSDTNAAPGWVSLADWERKHFRAWNEDRADAKLGPKLKNCRAHFLIDVSQPHLNAGTYIGSGKRAADGYQTMTMKPGENSVKGDVCGAWTEYEVADEPLLVKITQSMIGFEKAEETRIREGSYGVLHAFAFEHVKALAKEHWERQLARIEIEADDDVKRIFSTAMYHALQFPREFDEYGEYYSAFDDKVHKGKSYTSYSLWDTFRAEHAFLNLAAPERVDDMVTALLQMNREGGWLPKWPNPAYTGIMVGAPAEIVIAQAWQCGFRGFDLKEAYAAVKHNATVPSTADEKVRWEGRELWAGAPEARGGLTTYDRLGYVAADKTEESVSRTLDFGHDDLAAAVLAEAVGATEDAAFFRKRARNYRNLWNAEKRKFWPRNADGSWKQKPGPWAHPDYTEQTPDTAVWGVPYDIPGVIDLVGGKATYEKMLDDYFATKFFTGRSDGLTCHENEPTHHIAYLYGAIGAHDKCAKTVRRILATGYSADKWGMEGNDDCGQMSAWYILSALGFYPLDPTSGEYVIGSPIVRKATVRIGAPFKPATFTVIVHNQSKENVLVKSVKLNGVELKDRKIRHADILAGGTLEFEMASKRSAGRTVKTLHSGWSFSKDGTNFVHVTVPHDWAIAGPFMPGVDAGTGSLPWKGRGVYRRTLKLEDPPKGRVFLEFDGVMARSTVFVNNHPCGHGDYGYLGFRCEITPYLFKGENKIRVEVDTLAHKSRWYPGAGIYRDVRLVMTDKAHFASDELKIVTEDVLTDAATVKVSGALASRFCVDGAATVSAVLKDPSGKVVGRDASKVVLMAGTESPFALALKVVKPALWEMVCPAKLYTLELTAKGQGFGDKLTRRIGFREFRFDAAKGFFLNGKRVQLNGVDLHSDLGPLGMAFDRDAMRRQLTIMRDMGANALRTSHNCPAPDVLDLCDEMGIFVWDECFDKWNDTCGRDKIPLEEFVPRHLKAFVRRDRNHPCVFVWSIGNEISAGKAMPPGQEGWAVGAAWGTSAERSALFRATIRSEDATRPVAIGSCFVDAIARGDHEPLDLVGWNYGDKYIRARAKYPNQPVLDSESASALSEFGYYGEFLPTNKMDYACSVADEAVSSYDYNAAPWSDVPDREFARMERDTFCAGEFVWTGIDYLGEPTPYGAGERNRAGRKVPNVSRSSYFGICDLLAFPKDRFYLYRSHWNREAFTLHIVPSHWNFPRKVGRTLPVFVYTSAGEAELFVNGKSMGRRTKGPLVDVDEHDKDDIYYKALSRYRLMWMDVPYEPGEVKAVAYGKDGQVLGEEILRTAGEPVRVVLTPEPAYGSLCVVKVTLADKDGNFVPNDNRRISFAANGCSIAAVGNSNPRGMDSFKAVSSHPLQAGRAGVYLKLRKGQKAKLTASANGLESAEVEIP